MIMILLIFLLISMKNHQTQADRVATRTNQNSHNSEITSDLEYIISFFKFIKNLNAS